MLLTIDAGNTNIGFALYDGDRQCGAWRCATDRRRTADEYAVWLIQLMTLAGLSPKNVTGAILASVVPDVTFNLIRLCKDHFGVAPLVIGNPDVVLGIAVKTDRPEEVGADRLVNAVGAVATYSLPLVVLDFGTATTFDVVDANGDYIGGVIAPGINLSMDALHMAAAKLPRIDIKPPEKVIGRSTVPAMQAGVFWGYVGLIEGILARITNELGQKPTLIATGGLGRMFAEHVPMIEAYDPELTLRGLRLIYNRNRKT